MARKGAVVQKQKGEKQRNTSQEAEEREKKTLLIPFLREKGGTSFSLPSVFRDGNNISPLVSFNGNFYCFIWKLIDSTKEGGIMFFF